MIATLRPKFPYFSHRTMAEVRETEKLVAKMNAKPGAGMSQLGPSEHRRLSELLSRACMPLL